MKTGKILLALFVVAVIIGLIYAAVLTAEPSVKAGKACFLGYKAHCSFTPISTALCLLAVVPFAFYLKRLIGGLHG